MTRMWNLFEILLTSIPTDDMMLGLPGATVTFVHETIRIMNMCHFMTLKTPNPQSC